MQIGKLAHATDTSVETIRYYEREGLLPPARRTNNNYRAYGDGHLVRLTFIRRCRALDMSLDEVRALLALDGGLSPDCTGVNELLDAHIAHVDARISAMIRLRAELQVMRGACTEPRDVVNCPILHGLRQRTRTEGSRHTSHIRGTHHS